MKLEFSKYHGAGNDFIMVDNRMDDRKVWSALDEATIARLCQRHHGIGADGLILAVKAPGDVPYSMGYFNADGTPAEMCGNGLRCLMKFLDDLGEPVREMPQVGILTGAGPIAARFTADELIQIAMPSPSFHPKDAQIRLDSSTIQVSVTIPGLAEPIVGTAVGVGNPHFVIYSREMWEGSDVHELGYRLAIYKDLFPEGVNVGFARKESPDTLALVVWERGVGPTLSCGSGAIAAVAAGIAEGRFNHEEKIHVRMPGGDLSVIIGAGYQTALLEGGATRVYDGTVEI